VSRGRPTSRGLGGSLALALALALASPPALAAPSARLVYVREPGAEGCVDEGGLRRAVAARLGYDPFFPWAKVTVVVAVRRDGGAYHAEVSLVDEASVSRGRRTLSQQGDDCGPLVSALALSVSLALDPLSLTRGPAAREDPAPAPPPPSDAQVHEEPPPARPAPTREPAPAPGPGEGAAPPAASPSSPWHGWAALAALGSHGVTPGVAFGGLVRMKLERGSFALALEAGAEAPTSAAAPVQGSVQAWSAAATLLGCGRLSVLVGCGLVTVGPLVTSGVGLAVSRSETVAYGAAGPRLGLEIPVGARLRLEVFGQVAFALAPRALQVDGRDVFRQPLAAPGVGLGGSGRIF
jgi:hypothetical protein